MNSGTWQRIVLLTTSSAAVGEAKEALAMKAGPARRRRRPQLGRRSAGRAIVLGSTVSGDVRPEHEAEIGWLLAGICDDVRVTLMGRKEGCSRTARRVWVELLDCREEREEEEEEDGVVGFLLRD